MRLVEQSIFRVYDERGLKEAYNLMRDSYAYVREGEFGSLIYIFHEKRTSLGVSLETYETWRKERENKNGR